MFSFVGLEMAEDERAKRMCAHLEALSAHNLPAKVPSSEPKEVKIAYGSGLKMVHQKQGSEVCEMLGVDPRKGLHVSFAMQRQSKYGDNKPSKLEQQLYATEMNVEQRYKRAYTALRGGDPTTIKPKDLVVGDIVFLEAGDHVPADLRVLKTSRESGEQYEFTADNGYEKRVAEISTVIDNALPGGFGPAPIGSGEPQQPPLSNSNMADTTKQRERKKKKRRREGSRVGVKEGSS